MYVHTYLGVFAETARALFSDVHTNVVGKDKTASYSCKGGTGGGGSRVGWLGGIGRRNETFREIKMNLFYSNV